MGRPMRLGCATGVLESKVFQSLEWAGVTHGYSRPSGHCPPSSVAETGMGTVPTRRGLALTRLED